MLKEEDAYVKLQPKNSKLRTDDKYQMNDCFCKILLNTSQRSLDDACGCLTTLVYILFDIRNVDTQQSLGELPSFVDCILEKVPVFQKLDEAVDV
ncbi:hypothetical protein Tco_0097016 [Tanacetum coccineum]